MKYRLRTKYTLLIIVLIMMVVTVTGIASFLHYISSVERFTASGQTVISNGIMNQIKKRGDSYVLLLAENLITPLFYYDMDEIETIISEARSLQNITDIRIFNVNGIVIHDGLPAIPSYGDTFVAPDILAKLWDSKSLVDIILPEKAEFFYPILIGEDILGGVYLEITINDVIENIAAIKDQLNENATEGIASYITTILIVAFILMLFGIGIAAFVSIQITKPIRMFSIYAGKIARGDYGYTVDYTSSDELGDLKQAFDDMKNQIQQSTVSIERLQAEIEKKKQAEEKRHQMELELQRAQKMEAVGRLAAGVAHDLNNILSGIIGYPELILENLPKDSDLNEPLESIRQSGHKAAAVVQDLLTLARRGVSNTEVFDLRTVVQYYVNSPEFRKVLQVQGKDVNVFTDYADDLLDIKGSPVHLSKTVMNLANNAVEAMPNGGLLTIKLKNKYLEEPVKGYDEVIPGEYVVMSVSDTGTGIAETDIQKIFEPFFTKKTMGRSGTGLGLAVVWGTVKDHHGYIDVTSHLGQGTTFTLYFPATREKKPESTYEENLDELKGNIQRILVVDDLSEQREIASRMMTQLNYNVTNVDSGEAAISLLREEQFDLVLLDMIMKPGIDGLETYKQISSINPSQKVIIVSGYSESDRISEALELGANLYIAKPYTMKNIGKAIKQLLAAGC